MGVCLKSRFRCDKKGLGYINCVLNMYSIYQATLKIKRFCPGVRPYGKPRPFVLRFFKYSWENPTPK